MERAGLTADYLLAARQGRRAILSMPVEAIPRSPDEAYRAQDRLVAKLLERSGGRLVGYKVAATNPAAQQLLKVDGPFFGQMLSTLTFRSPASLPSSDFDVRCIEAEFGVEMGEDLPPGDCALHRGVGRRVHCRADPRDRDRGPQVHGLGRRRGVEPHRR